MASPQEPPIPIPTRASTASTLYLTEWAASTTTSPIPCGPRPSDSGYGTETNASPIGSATKTTPPSTPPGPQSDLAHSNIRAVPLPGRADLSIFRTAVPPAHTARFREVAPELQRLLQRHVASSQKGGLFRGRGKAEVPMSMRLMTVGRELAAARPAVVVFVGDGGGRGVEAVLDGEGVRRLCRPGDGVMPDLDVVVVGRAPRKRAGVVWDAGLARETELVTYCGVRVCLEEAGRRSAVATLGGVVKLTYGPGDFVLLGMTVGHVLEGLVEEEMGDDVPGFAHPRVMGRVAYPVTEPEMGVPVDDVVPPRDWALVEIDTSFKIKPNLIQRAGSSYRHGAEPARRHNGTALTTAPAESFPDTKPIEVALLGGSDRSRGSMLGLLSPLPGGIMLSDSSGFVDTYLLTLDDGLEIQDGDSGSWVVNPVSMEVYGHVVATDMTGDAYVVPLHASFAEMKTRLAVESVDLPTTGDLLDAALRATGAAAPAPAPAINGQSVEETRGRGQEATQRCVPGGSRERHERGWGVLAMRGCSRERRASELLSLCDALRGQEWKRRSVFDDGDSGYGSLGTPELFDDSVQAGGVSEDEHASTW